MAISANKLKTRWFCTECGAESPKWQGKCPSCGAWNTMVEEKVKPRSKAPLSSRTGRAHPVAVSEIQTADEQRITMPSGELNRVLGGGLVTGSLVLVGGEP
ncbi:MAG: DNA repair protein RadA, partial [Muribaculaceae bacterium]|nr:DNA repair protein RadA [Muribaculaceae bacterium]